jgi:Leucine-rich repeat (LRR) protein
MNRLDPWPTAEQWARMARQPSRFAPTLAELQPRSIKPCKDLDEVLQRFSVRDVLWNQEGDLLRCSMTGRSFLVGFPILRQFITIYGVQLLAIDSCFEELIGSPHLNELDWLNLKGNRLGDERLLRLLTGIQGQKLRHLKLDGNKLTDAGWRRIRELDSLQNIFSLNLSDNPLLLEEALIVPESATWLDLARLSGGEDPEKLQIPVQLEWLNLAFNQLGSLPDFENMDCLDSLYLQGNRLRDVHLQQLLALGMPVLSWFDLSVNYITEATLSRLSNAVLFPELQYISAYDCPHITEERLDFWKQKIRTDYSDRLSTA